MIYNFYIFNKSGTCIYYEEWNRKRPTQNPQEEQKLMFGLLYSLKSFVSKISPKPCDTFTYFKTNNYKLHFFETATNLKFLILTDIATGNLKEELVKIYKDIYVDYVVKNPAYKVGDSITCEGFITKLNEHIKRLASFSTPAPPAS